MTYVEQRQDKNDSIESKIIPILKLTRFFPHRIGGEKGGNFKIRIFLIEWRLSSKPERKNVTKGSVKSGSFFKMEDDTSDLRINMNNKSLPVDTNAL